MNIIKIPNEKIQFKYGIVDKHAVVFENTIVFVGSLPQCERFKFYMEGSPSYEILEKAELIK